MRELNSRGTSPASEMGSIPASVPGHVHLDLVKAGVIEDPFKRMHERGCAWVDETDWIYETVFAVDSPPAHALLRFNGLDTVAEILLNGEEIGRADNMFIPHEFQVGGRLKQGENKLAVIFRSALRVGRERQAKYGGELKPHWFVWGPRAFVRKMQCMVGWDWGPELVSCGIWQSVELIVLDTARIVDWNCAVEFAEDGKAIVALRADVERTPGSEETPLTLAVDCLGPMNNGVRDEICVKRDSKMTRQMLTTDVPVGSGTVTATASFTIDDPKRWWPNGFAANDDVRKPYLYQIGIELRAEEVVDKHHLHVGLRTIQLVREEDAEGKGESFKFRVNGEDIFAKGANWIPAHSFPGRTAHMRLETDTRTGYPFNQVQATLECAAQAGVNMLRVWGGGLYETEQFYNLCDRFGIMVWQDFGYACGYYPDDNEYLNAAEIEARAVIKRVRRHPSLALWCGNNENHWMFRDKWQGQENSPPRFLGENIYNKMLPKVVASEDPKTPYWPSSPFGGEYPNSEDAGDRHNWDVWHGSGNWKTYLKDNSRFVSEFGFASSCGLTAWNECLEISDMWPKSPAVRWHDKTHKTFQIWQDYLSLYLRDPQTLEDLVYYSQINQAEALKCGIEHWRRNKGRCWGTLFWQLNDCWPVQSWAVVDFARELKAAYFAMKRFYAPLLVSLEQNGDLVEAHLTNDLPEHVQGDITVSVESFDGDVLRSETFEVFVGANGTVLAGSINMDAFKGHERNVYVYAHFEPCWEVGGEPIENFHFLAPFKDLRLSDPGIAIDVVRTEGFPTRFAVHLIAERFAPFVWVRLEGQPNLTAHSKADNWFHLRAGQTKTLQIDFGKNTLNEADVRGKLRIRTL